MPEIQRYSKMDLKEQFEEASAKSKLLPEQSNENLLKLYSLFKQGTEGDCSIDKPTNLIDFKGSFETLV